MLLRFLNVLVHLIVDLDKALVDNIERLRRVVLIALVFGDYYNMKDFFKIYCTVILAYFKIYVEIFPVELECSYLTLILDCPWHSAIKSMFQIREWQNNCFLLY